MKKYLRIIFLLLLISAIFPQPSFPQSEIVGYLCETGINLYNQARYNDALQEFNTVLALDPENKLAVGYVERISLLKEIAEEAILNQAKEVVSSANPKSRRIENALDRYEVRQENRRGREIARAMNKHMKIDTIFRSREAGFAGEYLNPVDAIVDKIEQSAPIKLSGEYRLAAGVTSEDFIWKDANADKSGVPGEKNYRYLWGDKRENTYDEKIYDRLRVDLTTKFAGPLNGGVEMVIDPWTFIGKTHVTVVSTTGNDSVDMDLKYWSNSGRTINEIYRSDLGNLIRLDEIKILDGKTTRSNPTGLTAWATNFNEIPPVNIDRMYRPIRKLFMDYNQDGYKLHVFPISDEFEAYTSDDPLRLSNNHIYWEEGPWLDSYEPSRVFHRPGDPLKRGRWIRRFSFYTKSSADDAPYPNRLTFLRGASFAGDLGPVSLQAVSASPMNLWDDYDEFNSFENAISLKYPWSDDLTFGFLYTNKLGLVGGGIEAGNHVWAGDARFEFLPYTSLFGELAGSIFDVDEANGTASSMYGLGTTLGIDFKEPKEAAKGFYRGKVYIAYMDRNFYPGLSNYRYTRRDTQPWSRHIFFGKIKDEDEASIFGDGMDRGRTAVGLNVRAKSFEERLDTHVDVRNVSQGATKYVETVTRAESTYKVNEQLTSKILAYYENLPKTEAGIDPLLYAKTMYSITDYFSEEDFHPDNSAIEADKDPSIGAFGFGLKYDFTSTFSWEGAFERTNDPLDFPRGLLNDAAVSDEFIDGMRCDKVVPFLYDQSFFGLPPYKYYNIYKTKYIWWPLVDRMKLTLSYTRNDNKFAAGVDDNINHTGFEVDYTLNKKCDLWLKYTYSQLIDVYRLNKERQEYYQGHHNVFLGLEYNLKEDESFTFLYGEFVGYDYEYLDTNWSLSALDTQHIFRIVYNKKF